jgi:hypothetical protein
MTFPPLLFACIPLLDDQQHMLWIHIEE